MKLLHVVSSALVGAGLVVGGMALSAPKWAKKGATLVKCKGIAKKGQNDCGANGHACSGKAAKDNDPNEVDLFARRCVRENHRWRGFEKKQKQNKQTNNCA